MVMLLIANGCSCTRGEELDTPELQAWPALLGSRLGAQVLNLARDGASNRRIVRSTIAVVSTLAQESTFDPSDTLVLIAWTQPSRHEYRSETEAPEKRTGPHELEVDRYWQRIGPWQNKRGHRPSRAYYHHLWDEVGTSINFFTDWVMLDAFLQSLHLRARYTFAFAAPEIPESLEDVCAQLDPLRIWGGLPTLLPFTFEGVPGSLPKGPGGHPLAEGHAWFAQMLATWLLEERIS